MGLGSIIGAAGGNLLTHWGQGMIDQGFANDARAASEDMYRRRYRIMVHDLKAAGLNPMLAYMKDAGTPPNVGPASGSGGFDFAGASAKQAQSEFTEAQTSLVNAQRDKLVAETEELKKRAGLHVAHSAESVERVPLLGAQREQATASASELHSRTRVQDAELSRIAADVRRIDSQTSLNAAVERVSHWDAKTKETMLPFVLSMAFSDVLRKDYDLEGIRNESERKRLYWRAVLEKVYGFGHHVIDELERKYRGGSSAEGRW